MLQKINPPTEVEIRRVTNSFFVKTCPRTSAHLYDCFWCEYMATSPTQVVNKYNSYILLQESSQSDG